MITEVPVSWLFSTIAATAIGIVVSGLIVLRQTRPSRPRRAPRGRGPERGEVREHSAARTASPAHLERHAAALVAGDLLAARTALDQLAILARRDQQASAAVTAVWCSYLRQHSRGGNEQVVWPVQQRLSEHLTHRAVTHERLHLDLGGAVLRDLDLDGACLAGLNLSRAWLGGTTRISLTCSGNLDAVDAHFDGDLLAPRAAVEQRLSLKGAVVEGVLDLGEGLVVHRELDMTGTAVVGRTSLRGLVAGALRLHGPEGTALFGAWVDLTGAVALPVEAKGDEFTGGMTISPTPGATLRFAGHEQSLVEALRTALESPLSA